MVPRKLAARIIRALPFLLIPVLLAPALTMFLQQRSAQDEFVAEATIWVLEPPMIQQSPLTIENPYLSPAQRQSEVINDLLTTDGFRLEVAEHAGLLPGSSDSLTQEQRSSVVRVIGRSVYADAAGSNLLQVVGEAPTEQVAVALVGSVVEVYRSRLEVEAQRQSAVAADYFREQMTAAEAELAERKAAADAYLAAHPGADQVPVDREYALLIGRVESQTRVVEGIGEALQGSHLNAVSASQGLAARFNVLDQPALSEHPNTVSRTQQLGMPLAAAVLGAMVSAGYLLVVFYTDHSVYSREDLAGAQVRFLGYTPRIRRRHGLFGRLAAWIRRDRNHARRVAASLSGKAAL